MAIRSFLHPGLERFARTGDTSGIVAQHAPKLNQLLARECQDFCVWGGYSRGSPTRLPFVFCDAVCQT